MVGPASSSREGLPPLGWSSQPDDDILTFSALIASITCTGRSRGHGGEQTDRQTDRQADRQTDR